jgi:hypothetical protein
MKYHDDEVEQSGRSISLPILELHEGANTKVNEKKPSDTEGSEVTPSIKLSAACCIALVLPAYRPRPHAFDPTDIPHTLSFLLAENSNFDSNL